jgi:hypothetical protein
MKKLILLICILTSGFLLSGGKTASAQDTVVFNYNGDTTQLWTVPCNVDSLTILMWGAGGGSGFQIYYSGNTQWCGGSGAFMQGIMSSPTLPGTVLTLSVPHGGYFSSYGYGGNGGWPGGGMGGNDSNLSEIGGGGGGYAAIAISGNYFAVVGGGGAGGSSEYGGWSYGGGGGATTGDNGNSSAGYSGTGGTISAGGTGGYGYNEYGGNGSYLTGGYGGGKVNTYDYGGGGGGAGYFGGGGGGDAGDAGGGGSSYPNSAVVIGSVTFNPISNLQGTENPNSFGIALAPGPHSGNIGNGIYDSNGGNGQIMIITRIKFLYVVGTTITNNPCDGQTVGSAYAAAHGGTGIYTYAWSNGATTDTITGLSSGVYTVTVTDGVCSGQGTVTITQPLIVATPKQFGHIKCHGNPTGHAAAVVTGGTGMYTYLWMPSGGSKDTANGLTAGTYTLLVRDTCNDSSRTTVVITEPATLIANPKQVENLLCHGGVGAKAVANVSGGTGMYTYMWNMGATVDTAKGLKAVTYTVNVKDSNGCKDSAKVTITQPVAIGLVSHSTSDTGGCHGMVWVTVSGGTKPYNYLWADASTTDTVMNKCVGTFCCTVTDSNGCSNFDCANVVSSEGVQILVNNAAGLKVYPDPNNGTFIISGTEAGQVVEVYNYTGQKISSTRADNNGTMHFDISGQANGIYMLRILNSNGSLLTEKKIVKTN